MAVENNPFQEWQRLRSTGDYRITDTQATSLVRQQLSQPEYLTSSNRVNPGPFRNTRANIAGVAAPVPHALGLEDMWGWQPWFDQGRQVSESTLSDNLLEVDTISPNDPGSYPDLNQPAYVPPIITPLEPVIPESPSSVLTVRNNLKSVQYDQIDPRLTWTITHNLGYYPSVELFNNQWSEIDGNVNHLTKNTVRIQFTLPVSGHAKLI